MSLEAPRVKEEPGCAATASVCIKIEVESNEEAEGLKQETEHVTWEAAAMQQELSWEASAGLYTDHVVKDELVLGPESLQQSGKALMICGSAGRALASPRGVATASAGHQTDATYKLNTDKNIVQINVYMCDICGKLFKHKNKLISHIEKHLRKNSDEKMNNGEITLFCKTCNKRFRQSGHLYRHERTHTGAKHSCGICKKQFSRPDTLRLHALIHTGRRPYACSLCDKQFTQACNLARHTRIHTGEKPYACAVCRRRFTQSCDLKKHVRIHTGKPYSCEVCSKLFICSGDLRTHKRTKGHKRVVRVHAAAEK